MQSERSFLERSFLSSPILRVKKLRDLLARNLKAARTAKGWTQEELADRARLSARYVGAIERRRVSPSLDVLESLAKALNKAPAELLS
jgi:transcriptional regulator with XRE-family HTH domain